MATWSGFWNYVYDDGYRLIDSNRIRREFREAIGDNGRQPYNRVMRALIGAAVGGTASGSIKRVAVQDINDMGSLGGYRPTETRVTINRATTAADIAAIQKDLDTKMSPNPWPVDKSGNGSNGMAATKGL